MGNTLVWCKTKAEVREVLSEAKNMGYHMTNLDDYTEQFWSTHESETVINLHGNDKNLTYCYKDWYINHPNFGKIITASKFFGRKPILIIRKGRVVTAENKNTGEKAIATCSPDDKFDFGTGAMIAVARLIAQSDKGITKDAETVLRQLLGDDVNNDVPAEEEPTPFKVGDLVTLKDGLEIGEVYGGLTLRESMYEKGHNKPLKVLASSRCETFSCAPVGGGLAYWYYEEMLEAWDESKIREGDIVRVVNTGLNYSSYPQWVGKYISDPDMAARYCYSSPNTERKYKVLKIAEHEFNGRMLAFIEECNGIEHNRCYLIEVKGLEKVTE